jgi:uncharacterized protein YjiS (DUF1127 family)
MSTLPLRSSYATLAARYAVSGGTAWGELMTRGIEVLMTWHERARQRRQLQSLSDPMLRDIGLSRADVEGETTKPFWRP